MISAIIEIALGYVIWRVVPGMITGCTKVLRQILEIIGIIFMIAGGISLLLSLIYLF